MPSDVQGCPFLDFNIHTPAPAVRLAQDPTLAIATAGPCVMVVVMVAPFTIKQKEN